jgi:hypothetical protein
MGIQRPSAHVCQVYHTPEEYCRVTTDFIQQGIERREKVVCISEPDRYERVIAALTEMGLDVPSHIESGQLTFLSPREFYLPDGVFHPDSLLGRERRALREASNQAYPGFRLCGDMSWASQLPDDDPLIDYEIKVTPLLQEHHASAMCLYDRRRFPQGALLDVACVHPTITCSGSTCLNPVYDVAGKLLESR